MIQTVKKNLKVPRAMIVLLAGASPFIVALILVFATTPSPISRGTGWFNYLVQNQDDIIQSLIVSSVMVAVFSTLLRCKVATLVAGFQPAVIQAMFMLTDSTRHITLSLPLAAITVFPLLILLMTFGREIGQLVLSQP